MKPTKLTKSIWGWAMYDFANSAYTTSILTVIFSVYFVQVVVPTGGVRIGSWIINGTSLWSYLNSAVMAVVIVMALGLGAWADRHHQKKQQLILWAVVGSLGTMAFFFIHKGEFGRGAALMFMATLAYELSLVFYNAFLKEVAPTDQSGFVSGLGYAMGYVGGGLCLGFNMVMVANPSWFGPALNDPTFPVRVVFLTVGGWWLLFSIPIFLWVHEDPHRSIAEAGEPYSFSVVMDTWRQLKCTFTELKRSSSTVLFLLSYVIYNDGIQTIILMAAIFGAQELGMSTVQLGLCYLMIQFVAFFGAMGFGTIADRWSHKNVVLITLSIYAVVAIWGLMMKTSMEFWILGFVIGLILGGSQAASRSLFSLMTPPEKSGEYFAFYALVGKASALMGPFIFGVVNQFWGLRSAVGFLLLFFVVGGGILFFVKEPSRTGFRD